MHHVPGTGRTAYGFSDYTEVEVCLSLFPAAFGHLHWKLLFWQSLSGERATCRALLSQEEQAGGKRCCHGWYAQWGWVEE